MAPLLQDDRDEFYTLKMAFIGGTDEVLEQVAARCDLDQEGPPLAELFFDHILAIPLARFVWLMDRCNRLDPGWARDALDRMLFRTHSHPFSAAFADRLLKVMGSPGSDLDEWLFDALRIHCEPSVIDWIWAKGGRLTPDQMAFALTYPTFEAWMPDLIAFAKARQPDVDLAPLWEEIARRVAALTEIERLSKAD